MRPSGIGLRIDPIDDGFGPSSCCLARYRRLPTAAAIGFNCRGYRLVLDSSPTYAGTSSVRYALSNAAGTSAPGTITFTILARPDPSQVPEVIGFMTAQVDAAKHFAQVQTRNFNDRLEQLHNEGDRRRNRMNVRLGITQEQDPEDRESQELIDRSHDAASGDLDGQRVPGLLGYGPHGPDGAGILSVEEDAPSQASSSSGGMDLSRYALWSGGFVNFGERHDGGLDLDYTSVGVSGGIDYRFSDQLVGGFGVGYGRDNSEIGENGTECRAHAYSAAIYGSYNPFENVFLDGLVGGSWLDFDSTRHVSVNGDFATGSRSGHQLFGSLTGVYEFRDETWLLSPYGRVELSRSWLDGFTEDSGDIFALRYGDQSVDTLSGVFGVRAEYTVLTGWGALTPGLRAEYTHDFARSSGIDLSYADLDGLPYALESSRPGRAIRRSACLSNPSCRGIGRSGSIIAPPSEATGRTTPSDLRSGSGFEGLGYLQSGDHRCRQGWPPENDCVRRPPPGGNCNTGFCCTTRSVCCRLDPPRQCSPHRSDSANPPAQRQATNPHVLEHFGVRFGNLLEAEFLSNLAGQGGIYRFSQSILPSGSPRSSASGARRRLTNSSLPLRRIIERAATAARRT